jgi:membrane protein DedA with SNARE-associated domain
MPAWLDSLLEWLAQLPEALLLFILGLAAALESLVPPVPADLVILFGGFLAGKGVADLRLAFLVVWFSNLPGLSPYTASAVGTAVISLLDDSEGAC